LPINGGAFTFDAGTVAGSGTLALNSTTARFTSDFSFFTTSLTMNRSMLSFPTRRSSDLSGLLTLINSSVNANLVNQGAVIIRGSSNAITGTLTTTAASTLTVQADGFFSNAFVNITHGFTNNGLIDLTSINGGGSGARLDV